MNRWDAMWKYERVILCNTSTFFGGWLNISMTDHLPRRHYSATPKMAGAIYFHHTCNCCMNLNFSFPHTCNCCMNLYFPFHQICICCINLHVYVSLYHTPTCWMNISVFHHLFFICVLQESDLKSLTLEGNRITSKLMNYVIEFATSHKPLTELVGGWSFVSYPKERGLIFKNK